MQEALAKKFGQPVDTVIFGGTQEQIVADRKGVLLVNRGSLGTVAVLELTERPAVAHILHLVDMAAGTWSGTWTG